MKKGVAVILIISILLVCVSCNSKTAISISSLPSDPIIGLWIGETVVNSGEVMPITTDAYMDIRNDGKFVLYLDENTSFSGEWEPVGTSTENPDGKLYRLNVGEDRLYLFDKDGDDKLYVMVNGEDDSIMFTFKQQIK